MEPCLTSFPNVPVALMSSFWPLGLTEVSQAGRILEMVAWDLLHLRDRWVGKQIHLVDGQDIRLGFMAEEERVLSGHREVSTKVAKRGLILEEIEIRRSERERGEEEREKGK